MVNENESAFAAVPQCNRPAIATNRVKNLLKLFMLFSKMNSYDIELHHRLWQHRAETSCERATGVRSRVLLDDCRTVTARALRECNRKGDRSTSRSESPQTLRQWRTRGDTQCCRGQQHFGGR